MKKLFILFVCLVLCVSAFVIPVSASTTFNYMDYIQKMENDGNGHTTVYVNVPITGNRYDITDPRFSETQSFFDYSCMYHFDDYADNHYEYDIKFSPSWDGTRVNMLKLGNIDAKTHLNIEVLVDSFNESNNLPAVPTIDYDWRSSAGLWYYWKDGQRVATQKTYFELDSFHPVNPDDDYTFKFVNSGILTDPQQPDSKTFRSADAFYPTFSLSNVKFDQPTTLRLTVIKYQLVMEFDRDMMGTIQYERWLDKIYDSIAQQGKYIDKLTGVVNYIPAPNTPEWHQLALDNEEKEIHILSQIKDKLGFSAESIAGLYDDVISYSGTFLAVRGLMADLIDIPVINTLLTCSIVFGSLAVLVGLGVEIYNHRNDQDKEFVASQKSLERMGKKETYNIYQTKMGIFGKVKPRSRKDGGRTWKGGA